MNSITVYIGAQMMNFLWIFMLGEIFIWKETRIGFDHIRLSRRGDAMFWFCPFIITRCRGQLNRGSPNFEFLKSSSDFFAGCREGKTCELLGVSAFLLLPCSHPINPFELILVQFVIRLEQQDISKI